MQAVILAGGPGSRMRPLTETTPKCLLPVKGRPFIDYQLELLSHGGVRDIVLCVGYLGEMVEAHVGDGGDRGMDIEYSWDPPEPGGTAGALKHAEPLLDEKFFLTWGDSYVRVDHNAMYAAHCAGPPEVVVTMGVFRNENAYDASNLDVDGPKVSCYAKNCPEKGFVYIDAGISVFERSAVAEIPPNENLPLDGFFSNWASGGSLGAYVIKQRFYEIGSPAGLADFEKFVAEGKDLLA